MRNKISFHEDRDKSPTDFNGVHVLKSFASSCLSERRQLLKSVGLQQSIYPENINPISSDLSDSLILEFLSLLKNFPCLAHMRKNNISFS